MAIRRGFASKIESVEYFYAAEADSAKASLLGLGAGELDAAGERRDYLQYLSQGDNDASAGSFLVLERRGDSAALSPAAPSPFRTLATGQKALGSICRDLIAGFDPATGDVALEGRNYRGEKHNPGGFDVQIGVVKSVSLAAVFDVERRTGIRAAERTGYDDAIRWAFNAGLIATRVTRNGETIYEPARKVALAIYSHATSRAEDPHDHHHGALFAMCERQDGSLGTLSNFLLMRYGGAINAYKRCSEAGALKRLGLAVERDPDNQRSYRLAGVDQRLIDLFSKRREMIEDAARQAGIDTAKERLAAQIIAYDTRDDKRITDADALEARWENELRAAGYSREAFVFSIERAARKQAANRPVETADQRLARLRGLVMDAVSELQREVAVFTRARLYQIAFEALQIDVEDGAEAFRIVGDLETSGALVMIADRGGDTRWKVPGVLDWSTGVYNPNVNVTKETTTLYASDRDVFLFLVDDLNPIEAGRLPDGSPDLFFRGFYCWNSEVGSKTLGIASFYLRAVCQNRNLWGVEDFEEITIRHSKYAASRFAHEAAPALRRFADSSPAPFLAGVKAARQQIVARTDDERGEFLRKRGFSKAETSKIIETVLAEEGRKPESVFDFVQGITAVARLKPHQDARLDMETRAKKLFERVA